jgi:hypothetical protein
MCRAISEAFAALRAAGTAGLPGNLAVLHSPLLRMVAVRYGHGACARHGRTVLCRARAACPGGDAGLGHDVEARITGLPALRELLG